MSGASERNPDLTSQTEAPSRPPRRGLISFFGRKRFEQGRLRSSIAALVQEAAEAPQNPGEIPELDRQERALIANVLRLRGMTVRRRDGAARGHRRDAGGDRLHRRTLAVELIRREGHSRLPVYRRAARRRRSAWSTSRTSDGPSPASRPPFRLRVDPAPAA